LTEQKIEEAKEHHLDDDALIPRNVAPCRACRPWIFFINGALCLLKINGSGMENEERFWRCHFKEKMSQEQAHHHRKPYIRA